MREEILNLLSQHNSIENGIYIPNELEDYVDRILQKAKIILAQDRGELQGFIAYYNNDPLKKNAYLTMLLVNKKYQGKRLGSMLLDTAINDLSKNGFDIFRLEVLEINKRAINFYKKNGFVFEKNNGITQYMMKQL